MLDNHTVYLNVLIELLANDFFLFSFERWTLRYGSNVFGQLSSVESSVAFLHPNFRTGEQFNVNDIGVVLLPNPIVGSKKHLWRKENIIQNIASFFRCQSHQFTRNRNPITEII